MAAEPELVVASDERATEMVGAWAAPGTAGALLAGFRAERDAFVGAAGGPYSLWVAPLAARAGPGAGGAVEVRVWCAEVVLAQGRPSYALFMTQDLVMAHGQGWRLVSTGSTDGPSVGPLAGSVPTPAAEAAAALAGFAPLGTADGPR